MPRSRYKRNVDWQAQGYIGAGIVVVDGFGLVLGITRGLAMHDIGLPGGKADPEDPSLEIAAVREAFEETGVQIDPSVLEYVTENPGPRGAHVTFYAPSVLHWPQKFKSVPFEGYVGFYQPEAFVNPEAPYRDYTRRAFVKLGLL
jgi:8-oxo-dGTP pyrophosphatase MutT (NUDIX family)